MRTHVVIGHSQPDAEGLGEKGEAKMPPEAVFPCGLV